MEKRIRENYGAGQQDAVHQCKQTPDPILLYSTDVPDKVTFENLSKVAIVVNERFKKKCDHEYAVQGKPSPADGATSSATEGICSYSNIDDEGVDNFVDNRNLRSDDVSFRSQSILTLYWRAMY